MIVSPSTILLLPGVGVFLPSHRWVKISFSHRLSENAGRASGGMPACRCYNRALQLNCHDQTDTDPSAVGTPLEGVDFSPKRLTQAKIF